WEEDHDAHRGRAGGPGHRRVPRLRPPDRRSGRAVQHPGPARRAALGAGRPGRAAGAGGVLRPAPGSDRERAEQLLLGRHARPARDAEIDGVIATVENMGRAGIPVLGFHWMPASVWRTAVAPDGRGGAVVSAFDLAAADRTDQVYVARRDRRVEDAKDSWTRGALFDIGAERDDAQMWAAFEYFVAAVAPAAERAGVCVAVHPDDPPVPELGGVARIFRDVAALKRAADFWPGPGFGIELCLGTVSEMGGQQAVL